MAPHAACLLPSVQCPRAASDDDAAASDGMSDMDAFPPEAAAALNAFDKAAGRPQAYLQPSKQVAELARLAAKVGLQRDLLTHRGKTKVCRKGTSWPLHWRHTRLAVSQAAACARLAAPGRPPLISNHDKLFLETVQADVLQPALPAEAWPRCCRPSSTR